MIDPSTKIQATDSQLRGAVLKSLYEKRRQDLIRIDNLLIDGLDRVEIGRICDQLAEHDLIKWEPLRGRGGRIVVAYAQISARGIDVIEGTLTAPISIRIDQSRHYTLTNSDSNVFGEDSIEISNVTISQLAQALTASTATQDKKDEARNTIVKAFENNVVKTVLGTLAESVTKGIMNSLARG